MAILSAMKIQYSEVIPSVWWSIQGTAAAPAISRASTANRTSTGNPSNHPVALATACRADPVAAR
jgi:hypothetical protein